MKDSEKDPYVYKVLKGQRKASRDILLAVAYGIHLTLPETQLLLRIAREALLDPGDKRDSIFVFGYEHNLTVLQVNEIISEIQENYL